VKFPLVVMKGNNVDDLYFLHGIMVRYSVVVFSSGDPN
jgi:hypothetical protein